MTIHLMKERGTPVDQQRFTLKELQGPAYSKLDDDAFTRIRVILMNGIEKESVHFLHYLSWLRRDLREAAAKVRRIDHHQQTMVNWMNPADQSVLETTIGYEQVAIEVTASVAQSEPDPYLAQVYRFGLLEDFDHLYRYSALMDRVEGKDANNILQSYTDVLPGRPTSIEHRHPSDDLRRPYDRSSADPLSKLHALTITAGEFQTHDYYMNVGPTFTDPVARALYAEIASIEEQHVTQYGSLFDPDETLLEKWLLHEASEVYNYWSCLQYESNPRVKAIWERFLDYELGQLAHVIELFENLERRDAASILPERLQDPIRYESHRDFVRQVLRDELQVSARDGDFVDRIEESQGTRDYRSHFTSEGSPSDLVAADYVWQPGTELVGMVKSDGRRVEATAEE